MLASEIVKPARILAKDPPPGTYSDDALLSMLDLVCLDIIQRIKFPFARISTGTVAGQQSYMLPETPLDDGTGCVYLNGQLLNKTDIATLQGQQINLYDQGGFGTQAAGSAGPTANSGFYTPQWLVQPPTSFPAPNYQNLRTPVAPWSSGMAPEYAMHGGNIVIVPAPNANALLDPSNDPIPNLVIDMCLSFGYLGPVTWNNALTQPLVLQSIAQRIWFPTNFKNALVWGLAERIGQMDDTDRTKETRQNCSQNYRDQIGELFFWAKSYRSYDKIAFQTNRSRYAGSTWIRNPQYGGGFP